MKKFLIISLAFVLLIPLLVPFSVFADTTDTVAGEECNAFEFLGYSFCEYKEGVSLNYRVNKEYFDSYEKATGKKLEYGVVTASKNQLGSSPLISSNGEPFSDSVKKTVSSSIDVFVSDPSLSLDDELYLCAYLYDGTSVKYISGTELSYDPKSILYESLKNKVPAHTSKIYDITVRSFVSSGVNFSTSLPSSTIAWDRQRQYNNSMADYAQGSSYTQSELDSAVSGTSAITNFLTALVFPNASSFMKHFLANTGNDYIIDMGTGSKGFFKTNATKNHRNTRVDQALRAAEALAIEGRSINVYQTTEQVNHFSDNKEDWYLSVGSYFTCISLEGLTVTVLEDGTKTYSCSLVYKVTDFYNWDENNSNNVSILSISPKDLHNLHKAGMAKEFNSYGVATYNITWTEGQSASTLTFN